MKKNIPYFDYTYLWRTEREQILPIIDAVLARGAFILQRELESFEVKLAEFAGARYALGVADGTSAITIALLAAGLQPGSEVIISSHTFIATASAIVHAGGIPVPVECGPDRLMDPESARAAITKKTRGIVPTQLNGRVCDMDALLSIAREHELILVEDAAQALGAKFDGRPAGTFGSAGTISFYPAKSLGCYGDGGAILTNYADLYEKMRVLRDHGRTANGEIAAWGFNSRLDNLQAAVLERKLQDFPAVIDRRRQLARRYHELLGDLGSVELPPAPSDDRHFDTYQNFEISAENRDELRAYLSEQGIGTLIQWGGKAIHQFAALGFSCKLPFTEAFFRRCLMLPMNMSLADEDVEYIAAKVRDFYRS